MITFFSALDKTNSTDPAASLTGTKKKKKRWYRITLQDFFFLRQTVFSCNFTFVIDVDVLLATHLCLATCSWVALSSSRLSWLRAVCSFSLLLSTCSCNWMLRLRSCWFCSLMFVRSQLSCWILDSSLAKEKERSCWLVFQLQLFTLFKNNAIWTPTSFCLVSVFSNSCSRIFSSSSSCPLCFCLILSLISQ